jgi:SulP family sulfate permease
VEEGRLHSLQDKDIPSYLAILRIHGPLLFGSTDKVERATDRLAELPEIVIFRLRNMPAIDATGIRALEDATATLRSSGRQVLFCGARSQPLAVMRRSGFLDHVGADNVLPNVSAALERAEALHRELEIETGVKA